MPPSKRPRRVKVPGPAAITTAAAVALVAAGYWVATTFFPFHVRALQQKWSFWRLGVTEVSRAGIHAYTLDQCAPDRVSKSRPCLCVAMLHGTGDQALTFKKLFEVPPEGWLQKQTYRPLRLYAVDLPGSGESPAPPNADGYGPRAQAGALKQALEQWCPSWMLVGNSRGGWVASWLALDWPAGVERLVLLGSAGLKTQREEASDLFSDPTSLEDAVAKLQEFQRRAYHAPAQHPRSFWEAAGRQWLAMPLKAQRESTRDEDFLDGRLPSIKAPTLVLWGKSDRILSAENGRRFRALIPGSIWREVADCGHLPQKECPLEVVQAIADMSRFGIM